MQKIDVKKLHLSEIRIIEIPKDIHCAPRWSKGGDDTASERMLGRCTEWVFRAWSHVIIGALWNLSWRSANTYPRIQSILRYLLRVHLKSEVHCTRKFPTYQQAYIPGCIVSLCSECVAQCCKCVVGAANFGQGAVSVCYTIRTIYIQISILSHVKKYKITFTEDGASVHAGLHHLTTTMTKSKHHH